MKLIDIEVRLSHLTASSRTFLFKGVPRVEMRDALIIENFVSSLDSFGNFFKRSSKFPQFFPLRDIHSDLNQTV